MRLATITNWAYGATLVLTLTSGVTMLLASDAHEHERAAVAHRYALDRATTGLGKTMFLSADHARQFVVTGDPIYRLLYDSDRTSRADVAARMAPVAKAGALPEEHNLLREAIRLSQTMDAQQRAAILAYQRGDVTIAQNLLFGGAHERELERAKTMIERLQTQIELVLRAVGNALADGTRVAGNAFRYGGEEFTVLLPLSGQHAAARAETSRARIADLGIRHDGKMLRPVTISIGLATAPEHGSVEQLVAMADSALLRAKRQGRNRVEVAPPARRRAA
ncbi:GGDEF domain-containing protein [Sphingomonas sp.]|uniref:GGDEF domain-containing protein n=1 Tax=Sphingomonas sp. TaxID=28214 RepID=UPI003BA91547